jgi:DNA-binding NarL/FixJ family response regulator
LPPAAATAPMFRGMKRPRPRAMPWTMEGDTSPRPDAPTPEPARLLVVEDVAPTRDWLARTAADALGSTPVCADTLAAARAALARVDQAAPLVALVDLGLPDGSGVELIREIAARGPHATAIVTTIYDDDAHLLDALAAGAAGYLLKDRDAAELGTRLRGLAAGEVAISPAIARRILELFRARAAPVAQADEEEQVPLTARETDVLRMIGRGLKVAEAASALGLSEQTVAGYVKAVYRKLDISSRAEAALEAVRRGLA